MKKSVKKTKPAIEPLKKVTEGKQGKKLFDKLITIKQLAVILNVAPGTVYKWVCLDMLPSYRVGKLTRFSLDEVLERLKKGA